MGSHGRCLPATRANAGSDLEWRCIGASVRGPAHRDGSCQDAWLRAPLPGGHYVAAAADGAGSAPLSGIGAAVAVSAVIEELRLILRAPNDEAALAPADLRCATVAATQAIATRAAAAGHSIRDYATTLSIVVTMEGRLTWAQVGDGAIVVVREEGELELVAPPDSGEWANETCFLTDSSLPERLRSGTVTGVCGAALLTDGLHGLALEDHRRPFAPFFTPLFQYARSARSPDAASAGLARWLRGPAVAARTTDDVTLVLAVGNRRWGSS